MQSTNDSGTPSATPRTVVFGRVRVSLLNFATRAEAMFLGGHFYLHVGCATVREGSAAHHITRETPRAGRVPSIGTERVPHKRVGGDFLLSQTPTFPNNLSVSGRYDNPLLSPKKAFVR